MYRLPSIALGGCDGGENMRAHAEGTSDEGASVWDVSLDGSASSYNVLWSIDMFKDLYTPFSNI